MQIKDIKTLVARLGAIVDGWDEQSGAPAVERHIAASLLAELYEAVKFDTALAATEIVKEAESPALVEEPSAEVVEESVSEVIDLSDIFGGSFDDEPEPEPEPIEEVEEPVEEEQPEVNPVEEVEEIPAVEDEPAVVEEEVVAPIVEEPAPIVEEVEEETTPDVEEEVVAVEEEVVAAVVEESSAAVEEESAAVEEEKPAEEEKPESKQASLFDMEIVRRPRSSSSRRVIMSLYGGSTPEPRSEEKVEKTAEPKPVEPTSAPIEESAPEQPEPQKEEEQPVESTTVAPVSVAERIAAAQAETQSQQVLGDVIGAGTTTLAEAVAASQPTVQTVQNDRVNSLRNALGINDRFILIRDLFGGDGEAFEHAMDELDAFEDFNECLVYMSTYRWNPNCDGARMLMDLVTRKLL